MPSSVRVLGRRAKGCICGRRLLVAFNEGTCLACGHGDVEPACTPYGCRPGRLRRLPRDLGALLREGRRPDPNLDNVVRLDRLREAWKVPRLELVERSAEVAMPSGRPYGLTEIELGIVLGVVAGRENREIAEARNVSTAAVEKRMRPIFNKVGVSNRVELAVRWVREQEHGSGSVAA